MFSSRKEGMPWYMITETGFMITSRPIPLSISDSAPVIYAETPVPGLDYTPINPHRFGNGSLQFRVPIIQRIGKLGNHAIVSQIELLRQQSSGILGLGALFGSRGIQFRGNPQVMYSWGTHRPPLWYAVRKADFVHNSTRTTQGGMSQWTEVDFTLEEDREHPLFEAWQMELSVAAIIGLRQNVRAFGDSSKRDY